MPFRHKIGVFRYFSNGSQALVRVLTKQVDVLKVVVRGDTNHGAGDELVREDTKPRHVTRTKAGITRKGNIYPQTSPKRLEKYPFRVIDKYISHHDLYINKRGKWTQIYSS